MNTIYRVLFITLGLLVIPQIIPKPQRNNIAQRLVGEWRYKSTMWDDSELLLRKNGTFCFHERTCLWEHFTEGVWKVDKRRILLTSYDTYKPVKQIAISTETSIDSSSSTGKYKKGKFKASINLEKIYTFKITGPDFTSNIYFNNIALTLKNDTLYSDNQDISLGKRTFSRIRKVPVFPILSYVKE
ncbi:hypothetical protein [Xanthocytophaga agilis]|uniref:Uncharacterized protein n=1 Tax=Xanthocytophaga agilis TaxID=3048010 RepID=A0AAE3R1E0_9BACT|nr:hypothetical protein [Xanthocytophaga agilis]MDJ1499660.1 hypothetical protein [Xanthocytophaga agilis]